MGLQADHIPVISFFMTVIRKSLFYKYLRSSADHDGYKMGTFLNHPPLFCNNFLIL